jgi:hypothetical protein
MKVKRGYCNGKRKPTLLSLPSWGGVPESEMNQEEVERERRSRGREVEEEKKRRGREEKEKGK